MSTETSTAPTLTHAQMSEAATALAALLLHTSAYAVIVDEHGICVQTLNPFTFNRWSLTMDAPIEGPMLTSDRGVERVAWGQVAGFPARVELVTA